MSNTAVDQLRTTAAVIGDHLAKRQADELEQDIQNNYADDIMMLGAFGERVGHAGVGDYEYRGRRLTLVPRDRHSWTVHDRTRYLGVLQLTYTRIGDECPRYTARPPGAEGSLLDDGWATDWRLAVEWLADEAGR